VLIADYSEIGGTDSGAVVDQSFRATTAISE
jgi:hypothetical protein